MIRNALIVCTGNICRSPIGEGLLANSLTGVNISSAGTHAIVDAPPERFAIEVMLEHGVDISSHRGRQLTSTLVKETDLILVMEAEHRRFIAKNFHFALGKTFLVCTHNSRDVPDPYRGTRDDFSEAFDQIRGGVEAWAKRIQRLM